VIGASTLGATAAPSVAPHLPLTPFSWCRAVACPLRGTAGSPHNSPCPSPQHVLPPSLAPVVQGMQQFSILHIGDLFSFMVVSRGSHLFSFQVTLC